MPAIIPVCDLADPRLEPYRNVRDRDLRGRDGFIAEGLSVLGNAAGRSRHILNSLLVAQNRLARLENVFERLPADLPVYVAATDLMSAVAGFHIHRGILAHGTRADDVAPAELLAGLPARALVVALFGISNHDNLGGIFRNAAAFGADAVLLDPACCDPLYRKAIRVSVGASLICPFARAGSDEALVSALKQSGLAELALTGAAKTDLETAVAGAANPRGLVLLIGAEGAGLPRCALEGAQAARISMTGQIDSLNAATATGIALHAGARALSRL